MRIKLGMTVSVAFIPHENNTFGGPSALTVPKTLSGTVICTKHGCDPQLVFIDFGYGFPGHCGPRPDGKNDLIPTHTGYWVHKSICLPYVPTKEIIEYYEAITQ